MAACMGDVTGVHRVVVKLTGGRDNLGDPCVDGTIILKNGSSRSGMGACTGLNSFRIGTGFCEFRNELLCYIKCGEFLEYLLKATLFHLIS
jgi:hypothetical protein